MLDRRHVEQLSSALVDRAAGYLRNPVRLDRVTCHVCATPVGGYPMCYRCQEHHATYGDRLADAIAPLTYVIPGRQSGYAMRGYKALSPVGEHLELVTMLGIVGIGLHSSCAARLADIPISHWSTVPSLPASSRDHPLRGIVVAAALDAGEASLRASADAARPRDLDEDHFSTAPLPRGSHVLLVDDTWTSGGHAQSAALALRSAGASHVSVIVFARWLREDFGENAKFIRGHLVRDFDPGVCPWTGSSCP